MKNRQAFVMLSVMVALALVPTAIVMSMKVQEALRSVASHFASTRVSSSMLMLRDYAIRSAADPDNDGRYELPANDGDTLIPSSLPFNHLDDFGRPYRYCTWDQGAANQASGYARTAGAPPVPGLIGRLISGGPDREMQTGCDMVAANGDDVLLEIFEGAVNAANGAHAPWRDAGDYLHPYITSRPVSIGSLNPTHRLEISAEVDGADRSLGGVAIGGAVLFNNFSTSLQANVAGGNFKINGGGLLQGEQRILDATGNLSIHGGSLTIGRAGGAARLQFRATPGALPAAAGRSGGANIVLAPGGATMADVAVGSRLSGGAATVWHGAPEDYSFAWYAGDRVPMRLSTGGRLGVGTSPQEGYGLSVAGTFNASGYYLNGTPLRTGGDWLPDERENLRGGTLAFANNSTGSGNVAAGYLALHYGTSGSHNVAVGLGAGAGLGTTESSSENVAVGRYAMGRAALSGVAEPSTAFGNIAFGSQALERATAGSYNVALGEWSGLAVGTTPESSYNLALGYNALVGSLDPWSPAPHTASHSIAFGNTALLAAGAGTGNIAIGPSAGYYLGSEAASSHNIALGAGALGGAGLAGPGAHNFAAGYGALSRSMVASDNIAVGFLAGANLGGDAASGSNIAVGPQALYGTGATITAGGNVAFGDAALRGASVGTGNIAFGQGAQQRHGTGSGNIAFGPSALAGAPNTALNTGGGNIAFGQYALESAAAADGNVAYGSEAARYVGSGAAGGANIALGYQALRASSTSVANSGAGNLAIGYRAMLGGDGLSTDGSWNVAIGYEAGKNIGTAAGADKSGSANVAVGQAALRGIFGAPGDYNLGMGPSALYGVNTASFNVALGASSLWANSAGERNLAIGREAGSLIGTGVASSDNVAVGQYALQGAQNPASPAPHTGAMNVAVGTRALAGAVSGSGNVAVGHEAGYTMTSGSYNIALGYRAMRTSTWLAAGVLPTRWSTGSHNLALGSDTMTSLSSGSGNIVLGTESGRNISTGSRNILLGPNIRHNGWSGGATGPGTDNIGIGSNLMGETKSGSRNIAIGSYVLNATTGAASGNIAIGRGVLGGGADGDAASNIAIGSAAGGGTRFGDYNIMLGMSAGGGTRGLDSHNIAIGSRTLSLTPAGVVNSADTTDYAARNVALGYFALYGNTLTSGAVAIGNGAGGWLGYQNTGSRTSADSVQGPIVIGYYAHGSATNASDSYPIAIGYQAMYSVYRGSHHIAAGYRAYHSEGVDPAGSYNIALGADAGRYMDTNSRTEGGNLPVNNYNVAIGARALMSSKMALPVNNYHYGAQRVVALGYGAFAIYGNYDPAVYYHNSDSIAVGRRAGTNVTWVGDYNDYRYVIAVGYGALWRLGGAGTVEPNIALGPMALSYSAGGRNNVAIGPEAGMYIGSLNNGNANVAVGYQALRGSLAASTNSNSYNVAVGSGAMYSIGHATWRGDDNVALGSGAFYSLGYDVSNVAIGHDAGYNSVGGANQTAIGSGAARGLNPGNGAPRAVAIGHEAMGLTVSTSTSFPSSVAIGRQALYRSGGSYNIAIGEEAGVWVGNGGGSKNTAIGERALFGASGSTAGSNVAIGSNSLQQLATGSGNVAVGKSAGANLASATGNTLAGNGAFGAATSGTDNVMVGHAAGQSLASGSNNLFLGPYAGASLAGSVSNTIIIDTLNRGNQHLSAPFYAVVDGTVTNQSIYLNGAVTVSSLTTDGAVLASGGLLSSSDVRLKTNIIPLDLDGGLAGRVGQLAGVSYDFRVDDFPHLPAGRQVGLIAQDVEQGFPELVDTDERGFKALSYDRLTAALVEIDHAQGGRLVRHEERLGSLEGAISRVRREALPRVRAELDELRGAF